MKDDSLSDVDRKKIAAYHKSVIDSATVKGGVFGDSLSDVAFCNTKEGMHIRATELGVKAYSLGCSCPDCNDGFARTIDSLSDVAHKYGFGDLYDKVAEYDDSFAKAHAKIDPDNVGKQDGGYCRKCDTVWDSPGKCKCVGKQDNVYAKQIWNDAIEAAAKVLWDDPGYAAAIRKLKK